MDLTKRKPIRSKAITQFANGEVCTWPGCGSLDGVVFAHSNMSIHGKAGGRKADDCFGAFLCGVHHHYYDNMPENELFGNKEWSFMRAMSSTWRRLYEKGVIQIKGDK